ncbi:MAG: hypothetical protein D6679_08950 [Candidatus Hydrogenedentota bacterium]|nr:MAG: hypothetical protein D6679_08950 [Candidatus Hydrogenedentota bacterium]
MRAETYSDEGSSPPPRTSAISGTILFFAVIALVLYAYLPSLRHIPRADQIYYFCEASRFTNPLHPDILSLSLGTLSFNRTRIFAPGDYLLFRPLFFLFLALEYTFFRGNAFPYQLTGLLLHLILLWRFAVLLRRLFPDPLHGVFVIFFSVLSVSAEAVIWQHVNGYILFEILLLLFFDRFFLWLRTARLWYLRVATAWLILAGFTYELGVVVAALGFALSFSLPCPRDGAAARRHFSFAFFLLAGLNLLDLIVRWPHIPMAPSGFQTLPSSFSKILLPFLFLPGYWIRAALLPATNYRFLTLPRLTILPRHVVGSSTSSFLSAAFLALALFALILLALREVLLSRNKTSRADRSFLSFAGCFLFLLNGAYLLLISAGRILPREITYVFWNPNWSSPFWLYLLLFLAVVMNLARVGLARTFPPERRALAAVLFTLFLLLTADNAALTRQINLRYADEMAPQRRFLAALSRFVERHRNEPDFSFAWTRIPRMDSTGYTPNVVRPDGSYAPQPLFYAQSLYGSLISTDPKYRVRYDPKKGEIDEEVVVNETSLPPARP